jgi:RimJ/RimL family protein N-acetyltransferase
MSAMVRGRLVKLRAFEPAEAEALWRWYHDPEVTRWMSGGHPQSLASSIRRIEERPRNEYGNVLLGIETLEDGRLIGAVVLRDAEPETGCAELDIYIGEKEYWGRGFATDAMRTACRYGFEAMRLHKITLYVVPENHAAHHVYRKVGFVEEGRMREHIWLDGRNLDNVLMGILRDEWRR